MTAKLAFVLFDYFPYGGLQRDFLRILHACGQLGAKVEVFVMSWKGERPPGVEIREYPGKGWTRTARREDFVRFVRARTAAGYSSVAGFNRLPGLDHYFAADTCFAAKVEARAPLYRLAPRTRQYLRFERAVFGPEAHATVLALSPLQIAQYRRHYALPDERLILLPPGIAEDRRAGPEAERLRVEFRREFGLTAGESVILQIGSGFAVKGVDRSLRALASQPASRREHLRYFLVGQDDPRPYLRLARRLGVDHLIRVFPGRDDIPRFLQGADLLLHPAYSESAGMVLLEAVVAGLPVLCTDTCGYAFHVLEAGAGRVLESPFRQDRLDALLGEMLDQGRREWRDKGIAYGRTHDLYHLHEKVAALLCGERAASEGREARA